MGYARKVRPCEARLGGGVGEVIQFKSNEGGNYW